MASSVASQSFHRSVILFYIYISLLRSSASPIHFFLPICCPLRDNHFQSFFNFSHRWSIVFALRFTFSNSHIRIFVHPHINYPHYLLKRSVLSSILLILMVLLPLPIHFVCFETLLHSLRFYIHSAALS